MLSVETVWIICAFIQSKTNDGSQKEDLHPGPESLGPDLRGFKSFKFLKEWSKGNPSPNESSLLVMNLVIF